MRISREALSTETSHTYTVKLFVVMRISSMSCPLKQDKSTKQNWLWSWGNREGLVRWNKPQIHSKIVYGHEDIQEAFSTETSHRYAVKLVVVMILRRPCPLKQASGTQWNPTNITALLPKQYRKSRRSTGCMLTMAQACPHLS